MILTLDVGNSQIYGGLFVDGNLRFTFRKSSKMANSSDELGLFLRGVLRESGFNPFEVKQISVCTVVPDILHSIKGCCQKYFSIDPFVLRAGARTGLNIRYRNPAEVGPDRIANAIGAIHLWPQKNLVIVDFGTATTFCVVTNDAQYLGGMILPGLRLSMEALESGTARLPSVEIAKPREIVGRTTVESIQSGLYFGNLFLVREASKEIKRQYFGSGDALVIGTGGFARIFESSDLFDVHSPDLVLVGLYRALQCNISVQDVALQGGQA